MGNAPVALGYRLRSTLGYTISTNQANYDGNYPYGNSKKGIYRQKTTPVGSFPGNAWGLCYMHGNVREWCQDGYDPNYYKNSPREDPPGPAQGARGVSFAAGAGTATA